MGILAVVVSLVLAYLKLAGIGIVATWSWWLVALPVLIVYGLKLTVFLFSIILSALACRKISKKHNQLISDFSKQHDIFRKKYGTF